MVGYVGWFIIGKRNKINKGQGMRQYVTCAGDLSEDLRRAYESTVVFSDLAKAPKIPRQSKRIQETTGRVEMSWKTSVERMICVKYLWITQIRSDIRHFWSRLLAVASNTCTLWDTVSHIHSQTHQLKASTKHQHLSSSFPSSLTGSSFPSSD